MLQSTDLPTGSKRFRWAKTDPIFCTTVSGQRAIKTRHVSVTAITPNTFDGIAIS
jgi:hypothetical protein